MKLSMTRVRVSGRSPQTSSSSVSRVHHLSLAFDQRAQQPHLASRQVHCTLGCLQLEAVEVDLHRAEGKLPQAPPLSGPTPSQRRRRKSPFTRASSSSRRKGFVR